MVFKSLSFFFSLVTKHTEINTGKSVWSKRKIKAQIVKTIFYCCFNVRISIQEIFDTTSLSLLLTILEPSLCDEKFNFQTYLMYLNPFTVSLDKK